MRVGLVVEGFHDEELVKRVLPEVEIVVIRGVRVSGRIKQAIRDMNTRVDVMFIATDPDFEGNQFYERIQKFFEYKLNRLELNPAQCMGWRDYKQKIGLEYMSASDLRNALEYNLRRVCIK